jgi:hypothetical protein
MSFSFRQRPFISFWASSPDFQNIMPDAARAGQPAARTAPRQRANRCGCAFGSEKVAINNIQYENTTTTKHTQTTTNTNINKQTHKTQTTNNTQQTKNNTHKQHNKQQNNKNTTQTRDTPTTLGSRGRGGTSACGAAPLGPSAPERRWAQACIVSAICSAQPITNIIICTTTNTIITTRSQQQAFGS